MRVETVVDEALMIFILDDVVKSSNESISQTVANIKLPEQWHYEGSYMRFTGQGRQITLSIRLKELSAVDLSDGTGAIIAPNHWPTDPAGSITTIEEQRRWLLYYMFNPDSNTRSYLFDNNLFLGNGRTATGITNADPAVVTTATKHNFITGMKVMMRFITTGTTGSILNEQEYKITVLTDTTFELDGIDTSGETASTDGVVYYGVDVMESALAFSHDSGTPLELAGTMTFVAGKNFLA